MKKPPDVYVYGFYNFFRTSFKFAIVLLFSQLNVFSQSDDFVFRHLTVDNGLSNGDINAFAQDKNGFIWIGTSDGLNMYDGYTFKVYKHDRNNSASLCNNHINCLYLDNNKNLWIGTYNGLSLYDDNRDAFINFFHENDSSTISGNFINCIAEDKENRLWIGTDGSGLNCYDVKKGTFKSYSLDSSGSYQSIKNILVTRDNRLFLGTTTGIYLFDPGKGEINKVHFKPSRQGNFPDTMIYVFTEDIDGKIWTGTWNGGIFKFDPKDFSYRQYESDFDDNHVRSFFIDEKKNLWAGVRGGLKWYNRKEDKFYLVRYDKNIVDGLLDNNVQAIFGDNQGNMWFGHARSGISYLVTEKMFKTINLRSSDSRSDKIVTSVLEDKSGNIWIGYYVGGIDVITKKGTRYYSPHLNSPHEIGPGSVFAIFEDQKGTIWIGTYLGGLIQYNPAGDNFVHIQHDSKKTGSISSNDIRQIAEDMNGNLWLSTHGGGLSVFDQGKKFFTAFRESSDDSASLLNNWIWPVLIDKTDRSVWTGSTLGVSRLNQKTGKFWNYVSNPSDSTSLSDNVINIIFQDSENRIWIGTSEGLNLFVREKNSFIRYYQKDGLPNSVINGILEDSHGNLWISTNNGISKFNPDINSFKNYDRHDGLQGNEFSPRACFKNREGWMMFAGTNGVSVFHPDSISNISYLSPVVITEFSILNSKVPVGELPDGRIILKKSIINTDRIVLSHRDYVFSFEYAALQYNSPEKSKYRYMLKGFETRWNEVNDRRFVTYTNLPPGTYEFIVTASNRDGIWSDKGKSVTIVITPPWYKRLIFKLLFLFVIIFSAFGIYYIRINSLKKKKEYLERLVHERTLEIENKNRKLEEQADFLNEANTTLEERQQFIEEQAEELRVTAEDLNEKNKNLRILNATKDKFFSIIAHDLKNPFNSILGFSELLFSKYEKLEDEKRVKYAEVIHESVKKIYKLLENLLQWARSQTGNINYTPLEFDLNELVLSNIELVKNTLREKEINLEFNEKMDAKAFADPNMVNTVIRNLLTNAIKFTERGRILIGLSRQDSVWTLDIADTGTGIPEQKLLRIFEIDNVKSTEGTRGESGTGLGLIICKEFIEKNKGTIIVKSTVGKGSTFTITLPSA